MGETVCKLPEIQVELRPVRNPELEELRNEVLNSAQEDEKIAKDLSSELSFIHAAYLFYECGRVALAKICTVVSSTPVRSNVASTSSWKDLASLLGLDFHQIGCIENYKYSDYTELLLKTYAAQSMDATLGKIIMALEKLKRFDVISEARPHLKVLEKFARREQVARTEKEDNGYHSVDGLEADEATHDGILRPSGFRYLKGQLPITLRNWDILLTEHTVFNSQFTKVEDNRQQATITTRPKQQNTKKYSKRVMLTFAKDGEKIAYNVAAQLRKSREHYLPIGVLILEEHYDQVEANPEQFITRYFPHMDFVIPIVTPQYLELVDKNPSLEESMLSAIDTRYVQMIHTLMIKYYVGNKCRNDKFRAIIPDNHVSTLLKNRRMKRNLVLQPFVSENKLESLALRILKKI